METFKIMSIEEFEDWKLLQAFELASRCYGLIKGIYDNPNPCFNWSDIQSIEKAYFKQENKVLKLKSQCLRKGLVSLQD